ncbi:MAG: hypothetical protein QF704_02505 [Anaerolineales bacterium]|jgi:hypothetical protein|nr:hypothetical protein [Anaerolineales bacterium]|tara:strand:- start:1599 stop:2225 length:627 start_codon:yes stop_codon:yes gene_type:complete
MDPLTIMAMAKAAQAGVSWYQAKNAPQMSDQPMYQQMVQEYQRIGTEGQFSPSQRANMLREISAKSGTAADIGKANVAGNLTRQGLENSGIGAQMGAQFDTDRMRQVARASRAIAMANEASKSEAKIAMGGIGREQYQEALGRHQAITSAQTSLVGAIGEGISVEHGAQQASAQRASDLSNLFARLEGNISDEERDAIVEILKGRLGT